MKVLIATGNQGKIVEIKDILLEMGVEVFTPKDIDLQLDIPETGKTYQENARLKALAYSTASQMITLADDTGLEVEALSGLPGLHSARFVEKENATDRDRRQRLLELLAPKTRPWKARFVCAAILIKPNEDPIYTWGECKGEIISVEQGEHGFGYDPIFLIRETGKTMAELDLSEKNKISHRAKAVRALEAYLQD